MGDHFLVYFVYVQVLSNALEKGILWPAIGFDTLHSTPQGIIFSTDPGGTICCSYYHTIIWRHDSLVSLAFDHSFRQSKLFLDIFLLFFFYSGGRAMVNATLMTVICCAFPRQPPCHAHACLSILKALDSSMDKNPNAHSFNMLTSSSISPILVLVALSTLLSQPPVI